MRSGTGLALLLYGLNSLGFIPEIIQTADVIVIIILDSKYRVSYVGDWPWKELFIFLRSYHG
jgi:hypothetical protein